MSVSARFTQFLSNITLTDQQKVNGGTSRESVVGALNGHYYGNFYKTSNSQYVGSWGKLTRVRPPRDVDVLYTLPKAVYDRFELRAGNKQSLLLQEVKSVLLKSFSYTDIRGSGPVVAVPFAAYNVEVIPAFKLDSGSYWICMTDNGGRYKTAAYDAEATAIASSNTSSSGNTRHLVKMMKRWQAHCPVSIKSFYIELLAVDFLSNWPSRGKSALYYDWMVRDFLAYMLGKVNSYVYAPGTNEVLSLGSAWESKAKTAHQNAVKACEHESNSAWDAAGIEWQKLFGTDIPRNP